MFLRGINSVAFMDLEQQVAGRWVQTSTACEVWDPVKIAVYNNIWVALRLTVVKQVKRDDKR